MKSVSRKIRHKIRENVKAIFKLHCVEITEVYFHAFWQKFRESNAFTKEITKELV